MKTNLIQNQDYKVFEGAYNNQMPSLVKEGLIPLTVKDLMQYRIKAIQSKDKGEIDFWLNHYFDTVDGLAYFNRNLVVVPNSESLFNINQDSKLNQGAFVLTKDQYRKLSKDRLCPKT